MEAGSALANVLAASTLEAIQAPGAVDAVVVGSGAAGGLASALLTEAGLRVLVLEAGSAKAAAPLPQRRGAKALRRFTEEIQRVRGNLSAAGRRKSVRNAAETVVGDRDFAYVTPRDYPFEWVRARRLGGRMVDPGHGRQYYRLAADDFAPSDGRSPAWPLMPGELAPWYALVEQRLKLAGARDGVPWLPDSELEYFLEPNADEIALQSAIAKRWPMSKPIVGRFAPPLSGVAAAAKTGRLFVRDRAVARKVLVRSGRAHGIEWVDQSGRCERVEAPLIFLCASTLESTRLLLLSLGERSGDEQRRGQPEALGRHLMDHIRVILKAWAPPLAPGAKQEPGRCLFLPRFDARNLSMNPPPERGFGVQVYQLPWRVGSKFGAVSFGEMTPRPENRVTLDPCRKDAWNIPILSIRCGLDESEKQLACEQTVALRELAKVARATVVSVSLAPPGSACHECGTARMGADRAIRCSILSTNVGPRAGCTSLTARRSRRKASPIRL